MIRTGSAEYNCDILGSQTIVAIENAKQVHPQRGLEIFQIFTCENIGKCGIARYDAKGMILASSWDSCPAHRTMRESGSLENFRKLSKSSSSEQTGM